MITSLSHFSAKQARRRSSRFWTGVNRSARALADSPFASELDRNRAWYVGAFAEALLLYLSAWRSIKGREFFEAWCTLERAEIVLVALQRNAELAVDDFRVAELLALVVRWQSTYPYSVFASPEFHIKSEICSICRCKISPRVSCGHRVGKIYNGRECHRIVQGMQLLGVAIVNAPVQKYSVLHPWKDDPDSHVLVGYVSSLLRGPFDFWGLEWTYRWENFPNAIVGDDICPCMSGYTFDLCCAQRQGIRRKHVQVALAHSPPPDIPLLLIPESH